MHCNLITLHLPDVAVKMPDYEFKSADFILEQANHWSAHPAI